MNPDPFLEQYPGVKFTADPTALQQCIKDCLRLASYAGTETQTPYARDRELARLQGLIEYQVRKELDAWKAIMSGESPPCDSLNSLSVKDRIFTTSGTNTIKPPPFPYGSFHKP